MPVKVNLVTSNNRLESRMREIRQSGSAGGEVQINEPSLPLFFDERSRTRTRIQIAMAKSFYVTGDVRQWYVVRRGART